MMEYLKNIVRPDAPAVVNRNKVREYLQEFFLYVLYRKKIFRNVLFCGGTALRFLYGIKRFSEDLDFSLDRRSTGYDFENILKIVKAEFSLAGYEMEVLLSMASPVHTAFFKFFGLPFACNISQHKSEKLSIKFEVDANPPAGGGLASTVINREFMFYVQHYVPNALFSGKLHALLFRPYTKGRDWYDLLWYLTKFKDMVPDIMFLNNAARQTHPDSDVITLENWKEKIRQALDCCDMEKARNDVAPFLERPEEAELLTKEHLSLLLDNTDG